MSSWVNSTKHLRKTGQWKSPKLNREKEKKKNLNKDSLGDLRIKDNMKHTDICIIGIPEGDEGEKLAENLFKEVIG